MRSREWLFALLASGLLAGACSAEGGQCLDANGYPLNPQPDLPGCRFSVGGPTGNGASGGSLPIGSAGASTGTSGTGSGVGGASSGGSAAQTGSSGASGGSGTPGSGIGEGGFGGEGPVFEAGAGGEAGTPGHH